MKSTVMLTQQLEDNETEPPELQPSSDEEPAEKETTVEESDSDEDDPNWVENLLKENGVAVSEPSRFSLRRRQMGTTTPTRWSRRVIDPDSPGKVTTSTTTINGAHTIAQSVKIPSPGKLVGKSSNTSEIPKESPEIPKIPRESPEKVPELGGWTDVRRQRRRRRRLDEGKQGEQAPGEGTKKEGDEGVGDKDPCGCCWAFSAVKPLKTIEPEGRKMVAVEEWEEVEFGVDSGATETVVGRETLAWMEAKEGAASKRGVKYGMANGEEINNEGEKEFEGTIEDGIVKAIKAQVCDVSQPLLSVKKVVAAGNRVVFEEGGSYIESLRDGSKIWLQESQGMYMLKMWVKRGF